jgi:glutamate formiminotransferase/formiminotetrahydrofolate cyclodeaminase
VIEDAIEKSGAFTFAERLAAATPTPGGGAAAARAGLHAASLVRMVAGIALERVRRGKKGGPASELEALIESAAAIGRRFRELEASDEKAFDALLVASRKARAAGADPALQEAAGEAARTAAEIPLHLIETANDVLGLVARALEIHAAGAAMNAGSDLGAAVELSRAAARAAELNVRINLPKVPEPRAGEIRHRGEALGKDIEAWADALRAEVGKRFLPEK